MKNFLLMTMLLIGSSAFGAIWTQMTDFGGVARHRTTMLTLGNKIYTGLGHYNGAGPNILFVQTCHSTIPNLHSLGCTVTVG